MNPPDCVCHKMLRRPSDGTEAPSAKRIRFIDESGEARSSVRPDRSQIEVSQEAPLLAVSNAVVRFYKETFGRGPTKARTHYAGPDILICTLRNCLTAPDRNLVRAGEEHRVVELRRALRDANGTRLDKEIEQITGRSVWSSVSGLDVKRELSTEVFYLASESDGDGRAPVRRPASGG